MILWQRIPIMKGTGALYEWVSFLILVKLWSWLRYVCTAELFASGSRDGSVALWDLRTSTSNELSFRYEWKLSTYLILILFCSVLAPWRNWHLEFCTSYQIDAVLVCAVCWRNVRTYGIILMMTGQCHAWRIPMLLQGARISAEGRCANNFCDGCIP